MSESLGKIFTIEVIAWLIIIVPPIIFFIILGFAFPNLFNFFGEKKPERFPRLVKILSRIGDWFYYYFYNPRYFGPYERYKSMPETYRKRLDWQANNPFYSMFLPLFIFLILLDGLFIYLFIWVRPDALDVSTKVILIAIELLLIFILIIGCRHKEFLNKKIEN